MAGPFDRTGINDSTPVDPQRQQGTSSSRGVLFGDTDNITQTQDPSSEGTTDRQGVLFGDRDAINIDQTASDSTGIVREEGVLFDNNINLVEIGGVTVAFDNISRTLTVTVDNVSGSTIIPLDAHGSIGDLRNALNAEIADRIAGDADLLNRINEEVANRLAEDQRLTDAINTKLSVVTSDATLTGDGTTNSPLAVTDPFTQADQAKLGRLNVREVSKVGDVTTITRDDGTVVTITEGGGTGPGGDGNPFDTRVADWDGLTDYADDQLTVFNDTIYRANQDIAGGAQATRERGTITVDASAQTNPSLGSAPERFDLDFAGSTSTFEGSNLLLDGAGATATFTVPVPFVETFTTSGTISIFISLDDTHPAETTTSYLFSTTTPGDVSNVTDIASLANYLNDNNFVLEKQEGLLRRGPQQIMITSVSASGNNLTFTLVALGPYLVDFTVMFPLATLAAAQFLFGPNGTSFNSIDRNVRPRPNPMIQPTSRTNSFSGVRIQVPADGIDEEVVLTGGLTSETAIAQDFATQFNANTDLQNYFTMATVNGTVVEFETDAVGDITAMLTPVGANGLMVDITATNGFSFIAPMITITSGSNISETLILSQD